MFDSWIKLPKREDVHKMEFEMNKLYRERLESQTLLCALD